MVCWCGVVNTEWEVEIDGRCVCEDAEKCEM